MFVGWFTVMVLVFSFCAGISCIRASSVKDVTADLLGKFYGIAGFTFLLLTTAFAIIAGLTIYEMKNKFTHIYEAEGTKMIIATAVLTIPLFARGIFDLVIGTNQSVRDSVGVTD
jgi:hypothetical protein